ncbi:hypothetical protein FPV16_18995 [Methylobacterium sp. W2]|uniref:hypothetical protein n=1 Tax=Methylobacterium sp. W2 TaxID=2598107 RepID=UPI001D0C813C|nr:hypothetical protein [Methylobacterium sp. W2]MCC0808273.1 hypothetical protein [Methylobacterium sp. W2]
MLDDGAELPALVATILRPWASAVETASLGMGEIVTAEASNSASSLKRRVKVTPELDLAIAEAVAVSALLAAALDHRNAETAELRATALAALVKMADKLRSIEPSESTRTLGLGW